MRTRVQYARANMQPISQNLITAFLLRMSSQHASAPPAARAATDPGLPGPLARIGASADRRAPPCVCKGVRATADQNDAALVLGDGLPAHEQRQQGGHTDDRTQAQAHSQALNPLPETPKRAAGRPAIRELPETVQTHTPARRISARAPPVPAGPRPCPALRPRRGSKGATRRGLCAARRSRGPPRARDRHAPGGSPDARGRAARPLGGPCEEDPGRRQGGEEALVQQGRRQERLHGGARGGKVSAAGEASQPPTRAPQTWRGTRTPYRPGFPSRYQPRIPSRRSRQRLTAAPRS